VVGRPTYLEIIDRDRAAQKEHAAAPRKAIPPKARPDYPRHDAIQRDLARHYERCKGENRGRFKKGRRLKQYCSAVAWTIVRGSGKYPDYPKAPKKTRAKETTAMAMPQRDPRSGKFLKRRRGKARRRARAAAEPRRVRRRARRVARAQRRAAAAPRRRHRVGGYTMHRRGRAIRVRGHVSRETPRRRRGRGRRRRMSTVVREMVYAPRRYRRRRAREAPVMRVAGTMLVGAGVLVGATAANMVHRYAMTMAAPAAGAAAPTWPTAQSGATAVTDVNSYNDLAVSANPSMLSIGLQLGVAVAGFALGAVLPWAPVKAVMLGIGLGALGHLGVQLINAYVLEPLFSGTATGTRWFAHEYKANGSFGSGTMGNPNLHGFQHRIGPRGQMGQLPGLPAAQPQRFPHALATKGGGFPVAVPRGATPPAQQQPSAGPGYASQFAVPGGPPAAPPAAPQVPVPPTGAPPPPAAVSPVPGANGQPPATSYAGGCQPNCACGKCAGGIGQPPPDAGPYAHPGWALLMGMDRKAA
jgi:hypothetical protein